MIPKQSIFQLAKALEGIPILGALGGSAAARAGLRYGDILLSVNGVRTKNVVDYVEAKALRNDGMDVVVFRTGVEMRQELRYTATAPVDPAAILAELISLRIVGGDDDGGGSNEGGSA